MNVPARYPYDPRWQIVAMLWTLAAALVIASLIPGAYVPRALGIIAPGGALVFAGLVALISLRRYAFPRYLVLEDDGVWLPSGFLRLKVRRVVFEETTDVWESFLPMTVVLCLRSHGKTYELTSTFLPDHETYLEVAGYIHSRVVG